MVSGLAIVGKRPSTKKAKGPMKKQWAADQSPPPTAFSSLSSVSLALPWRLQAIQITSYRSGFSYFSTL
jgi:hypothetical protein